MDFSNFVEQARIAGRLLRAPPVEIAMYGSQEAWSAYRTFTKPHRRLPFLRNKTFGVALSPVPQSTDDPFTAPAFRAMRRRRKHALSCGYTFAPFEAREFIDPILAINRSSRLRQGKPLAASYTDAEAVTRYCERRHPFFGIFDKEQVLRAYCHAPALGDVVLFARFFGEFERLEDGIMYLLFAGIAEHLAAARVRDGHPAWIMYDTFVGGTGGMRTFKERCGFHPYRVNWVWRDGVPS